MCEEKRMRDAKRTKSAFKAGVMKFARMFFLSLLLGCSIALNGCAGWENKIQNHNWKFDNVQKRENDGAVVACSKDSRWASGQTAILELTLRVEENSFTVRNENTQATFVFSYQKAGSSGKSEIYAVACNGSEGIASVSETVCLDKTEIPTLLITIGDYNLYFYER